MLGPTAARAARTEPEPRAQLQLPQSSSFVEARQLLARQKWAEAAIVLRTVVRNNPGFSPAALGLARALTFSGRREEALGILLQAAERESRSRKLALTERARVLSRLFLTNSSFQLYQDGLNLMGTQKYGAAREKFDSVLEQEPDNVEVLTRAGQCLAMDGEYDNAVERLRLARKLSPYEPEIRLWLGHAMHQRGELRDSIEELKAAYQELKGSELAAIWYADLLFTLGQKKQALALLEADTRTNTDHVSALLSLAKLRLRALGDSSADKTALWAARKDLQLVASRLAEYQPASPLRLRDDLGIDLLAAPAELKTETQKVLRQVEDRLEEVPASSI